MSTSFGRVVPILRIFSVEKTREFYLGWLGFEVTFEHRFAPDLPLYMGVRRGDLALHLSEHHGDATPGTHLRVETTGLDGLQAELLEKRYGYGRPGIEAMPWGRDMTVHDPFGNRITFTERSPA